MIYKKTITLKDGRECLLRNGTGDDAEAVLSVFIATHEQTDYLTTYTDEMPITLDEEREFLDKCTEDERGIEMIAEVGGKIVGNAGIACIKNVDKLRHRASFGISIDKEYWGLGIGRGLTESCIECAKKAGYTQLELEAVADNETALSLYRSAGFVEYGRNPKGFKSRISGWQELVLMRLELE